MELGSPAPGARYDHQPSRYFREAHPRSPNGTPGTRTDSPPSIVLVGAGGFGREVLQYVEDALRDSPEYLVKGFLDDNEGYEGDTVGSVPVLGDTSSYDIRPTDRVIVTIGNPVDRLKVARRLEARHASFLTIVHPRAYVADSATLGPGCVVAPFATIGAEAAVGAHSFLTFAASVAHHATVGSACGFSPYSVANGGSVLGDAVFLGTHAVVNPYQKVGGGSKIAAGAVVYHDVPPGVMAVGNPARVRPLWAA